MKLRSEISSPMGVDRMELNGVLIKLSKSDSELVKNKIAKEIDLEPKVSLAQLRKC